MEYSILLRYFKYKPHDVHTNPLNGMTPHLFNVSVYDGTLRVSRSQEKQPSCNINFVKILDEIEFEAMLDFYERRKKGEHISDEVAQITKHSSYWFGIFYDVEECFNENEQYDRSL